MPTITIPFLNAICGIYSRSTYNGNTYLATNPDGLWTSYNYGTAGGYITESHRMSIGFFNTSTDVNNLSVTQCRIKISSTESINKQITLGIPKTKVSTDPTAANGQAAYSACLNAQTIQTFPANYSFASGAIIIVTKAQLLQILQYGLSLACPDGMPIATLTIPKSTISIEVDYADPNAKPVVTAVSPKDTSVTVGDPITLTWSYAQAAGTPQASYVIELSKDGGSWQTLFSGNGTATSYTIPANTLTTASYQWRVKATSSYAVSSDYSAASFQGVMGIYMPSICRIVKPRGTTIIGTENNVFEWSYSQSVNSPQTHYDLQVSYNGGTSWVTLRNKIASAVTNYIIPANTLNTGSVLWRVRTYHNSGTIVSDWDETAIIVFANPGTATVQCDGRPRPRITWNAISGQQAYQVQIVKDGAIVHDSRTQYGNATEYIPDTLILPDGVVTAKVRVQNNLSVWGNWAEVYSDIKNVPGMAVTFNVSHINNNATLIYSSAGTYALYYIYREGKLIAITKYTEYTDYTANGNHLYFVRAETSSRYYTDSESISLIMDLKNAVIASLSDMNWINLEWTYNGKRKHQYTQANNIVFKNYEGRKYPVSYSNGQANKLVSTNVMFDTLAEAEDFMLLGNDEVIYKDIHGVVIKGVFSGGISMTYENGTSPYVYVVSYTVTQTDFEEVERIE